MSLFALSKGSEKHRSTEERQASAVAAARRKIARARWAKVKAGKKTA